MSASQMDFAEHNSVSSRLLYPGFIEELVQLLRMPVESTLASEQSHLLLFLVSSFASFTPYPFHSLSCPSLLFPFARARVLVLLQKQQQQLA